MKPIVYHTSEITPESLLRIYEALNAPLKPTVAVKLSTGEPPHSNYLRPEFIKPLVQKLQGTIVECNTAYEGRRSSTPVHWATIREHGFSNIAPCDILDAEFSLPLPVYHGFHLETNYVGANLRNYGSLLILSHFKGHQMAGLGGALKNIAIGLASAQGKQHIHVAGSGETSFEAMMNAPVDDFLESMADAVQAVMTYMGPENIVCINVANRLSVDCDCNGNPAEPEMGDLGIYASTDPVAVDQACVDAVYNSPDPGKKHLIERMESRHGIRTIEAAALLGLGCRQYRLVEI